MFENSEWVNEYDGSLCLLVALQSRRPGQVVLTNSEVVRLVDDAGKPVGHPIPLPEMARARITLVPKISVLEFDRGDPARMTEIEVRATPVARMGPSGALHG